MTLPRLAQLARTVVTDREGATDLGTLAVDPCGVSGGTALAGAGPNIAGRSVLIATGTQRAAAIAMVELDGLASRMTIAPPDLKPEDMRTVLADAAVEAIVTDDPAAFAGLAPSVVALGAVIATVAGAADVVPEGTRGVHDTQWVMLTSGTSGRAKIVAHTLAALTGAIRPIPFADASCARSSGAPGWWSGARARRSATTCAASAPPASRRYPAHRPTGAAC